MRCLILEHRSHPHASIVIRRKRGVEGAHRLATPALERVLRPAFETFAVRWTRAVRCSDPQVEATFSSILVYVVQLAQRRALVAEEIHPFRIKALSQLREACLARRVERINSPGG